MRGAALDLHWLAMLLASSGVPALMLPNTEVDRPRSGRTQS
jgi:hypothetical protein